MPDTVRWGILSTADIGVRKVIPGIQQAARCEVVAMASRDGETARSVAAGLGIARSHGSYEALLADPIRVQGSLRRDPAMGIDVLTSGILDFEDGIATFPCSLSRLATRGWDGPYVRSCDASARASSGAASSYRAW